MTMNQRRPGIFTCSVVVEKDFDKQAGAYFLNFQARFYLFIYILIYSFIIFKVRCFERA